MSHDMMLLDAGQAVETASAGRVSVRKPVAAPSCATCPLRALPVMLDNSAEELGFIESLRVGQTRLRAGATLLHEGQRDGPLATLFSGWAFRYKTLQDGRRQILNFLLPGDFIGLQQKMAGESPHGVEAITDVVLCTFPRDALWRLHQQMPSLGYDITWLAAHEESIVDENLISVGRRTAAERVAMLLIRLYKRAAALQPAGAGRSVPFPITQQHVADALGLSLVHTNKTLRRLHKLGLYGLAEGRLTLLDPGALERMAEWYGSGVPEVRPLL